MAGGNGSGNGNGSGFHPGGRPAWRGVRADDAAGVSPEVDGPGVSGRRFVVLACLAVLATASLLYLAMQGWKARHARRAAFGAERVAPTVGPLAEVVPEGVDPAEWRAAVADTRQMLVALTASGLLDLDHMERLRAELAAKVGGATPATARAVLTAIWDDAHRKAGPVIEPGGPVPANSRHAARVPRPPRPKLLPPPPKVEPRPRP